MRGPVEGGVPALTVDNGSDPVLLLAVGVVSDTHPELLLVGRELTPGINCCKVAFNCCAINEFKTNCCCSPDNPSGRRRFCFLNISVICDCKFFNCSGDILIEIEDDLPPGDVTATAELVLVSVVPFVLALELLVRENCSLEVDNEGEWSDKGEWPDISDIIPTESMLSGILNN